MKRGVVAIVSVIAGWLLATAAVIALQLVGLNIPAALARTYPQYSTFQGGEILVLMIALGWLVYRILGRSLLGDVPDRRPWRDRVPDWVREPTAVHLVVVWVVAVFTVLPYLLAIYMSWRYYVTRRDGATKVCPRCAERIKAAALVCRHCGADFAPVSSEPAPAG